MARKSSLDSGILNDSAFYILSSLINANHGYMIMKLIDEKTLGTVSIGPASLYTTIKKLLLSNLIELIRTDIDGTKVYQITEKGLIVLKNDINRKRQMINFAEYSISMKEDTNEI